MSRFLTRPYLFFQPFPLRTRPTQSFPRHASLVTSTAFLAPSSILKISYELYLAQLGLPLAVFPPIFDKGVNYIESVLALPHCTKWIRQILTKAQRPSFSRATTKEQASSTSVAWIGPRTCSLLISTTLLSLLVPQNSNIRSKISTAFCHNTAKDPNTCLVQWLGARRLPPPPFSITLTRAFQRDLILFNIHPASKLLPLSSISNTSQHNRIPLTTSNPLPISITASRAMSSQ